MAKRTPRRTGRGKLDRYSVMLPLTFVVVGQIYASAADKSQVLPKTRRCQVSPLSNFIWTKWEVGEVFFLRGFFSVGDCRLSIFFMCVICYDPLILGYCRGSGFVDGWCCVIFSYQYENVYIIFLYCDEITFCYEKSYSFVFRWWLCFIEKLWNVLKYAFFIFETRDNWIYREIWDWFQQVKFDIRVLKNRIKFLTSPL